MKIIESKPLTIPQAKELLEERVKDTELEYEQTQAADHAEKFSHHKADAVPRLSKELVEKCSKLDPETVAKLVDVSPKRLETLKAILLRKRIDVSDEEATELLKMLR